MTVLVRGADSLLKGQGVVATMDDGESHILAGNLAAPSHAEYNPFFHDPRTGNVRTDIPHKFPMEALGENMARDFIDNKVTSPERALALAQKIINRGHERFNNNHHDKSHHLPPVFDERGQLNPMYKHTTVSPQYQTKAVRTHERHTTTPDGMPINYWANSKPHPAYGRYVEAGALHAWREIDQELKDAGLRGYTSQALGSHIEPGSMTNKRVMRHSTLGAAPGEHVARPVNEMLNQSRGLPSADPVNILFDKEGRPKLPAAFWMKNKKGRNPHKVKEKLTEEYGVDNPQLLDAMAESPVGQLLAGTGKRPGGVVNTVMNNFAEILDIHGENAELYERALSHIQRSTTWTDRGGDAAAKVAAMMSVADATKTDLSNFGSWSKVQPGVIDEWKRVAPLVSEARGGGEARDWSTPVPEHAHPSAAPPRDPAMTDGPALHEVRQIAPREQIPVPPVESRPALEGRPPVESRPALEGRPPVESRPPVEAPRDTPYPPMRFPPTILRSEDPTTRILFAMEEMQLAEARKNDEIRKYLPTKRNLRAENTQDVNLVANRLDLTAGDVIGLLSAGGDWENVAKAFSVTPSVVGAVKVAFS